MLYSGFALGLLLCPLSGTGKVVTLTISAAFFAAGRNHLFPALGICSCLYLVYYLPPASWLRFAAWLNCGFVVYAGYGVVHSRLTGRHHSKPPAEHDAYAAYVGAWLALVGTTLLFGMRGFDLWLGAPTKADMTGSTRAGVALAAVLRPQSWLEWSWFLVIPLTLTAFVLCPIVIRRALRARRAGVRDGYGRVTIRSLSVASVVGIITVAYLLLVVMFYQS